MTATSTNRATVRATAHSLAFLAAIIASAVAGASDDGLLTRVFDVRQITSPVAERPGPGSLGVSVIQARDYGEDPFGSEFESDFDSESRNITEENLLAHVDELLPGLQDAQGASLRLVNGRLMATLEAKAMATLEDLLEKLSVSWNAPLGVRAVLFEPGQEGDEPSTDVDDALAARLIAAAGAAGRWSESLSLCGTNNRRFHAVKGSQSVYLAEYDVEVASGASIDDPVMGSLETGVMVDLRPSLSSDGSTCSVTLRVSCSFPSIRGELVETETPAGSIQRPDLSTVNFQTTLTVKTGSWVLLSSGGKSEAGSGSKGVRLLIRIDRLPGSK